MEKSVNIICMLAVFGVALWTHMADASLLHGRHVRHEDKLQIGSPSWCLDKLRSFNLTHFEVLPGNGWDNLENKERGRVVQHSFYECRTTDDGKFLLPDGVITIPVKSSKLDVFSEIYSSWMDYKETTSKSINIAAKYHMGFFSIDGMFSAESQSAKENQIEEKTSIARTQARYVKYTVKLQPDTTLHPAFRAHVMEIAKLIQMDETAVARYESQQLVRDFGTHVLTGMDAGAVIAKIQHITQNYVSNRNEKNLRLLASLSTSFSLGLFGKGGVSTEGEGSSHEQELQEFSNNVAHATIKTYGGPSYLPQNFQLDDWAKRMDENMVAVDKEGTPLYYFITASAFPDLPNYIIPDLFNQIRHAVYLYYKFNTYRGCTDVNKQNFNRIANVEDGTCTPPSTNFTFGGVYQTCTQDAVFQHDHCSDYITENPLTGSQTCPSDFFPVLLDKSEVIKTETTRECHRVWYKLWIGKKCTDVPVPGSVTVSSYWCVANGDVPQSSGYMFGGLFTPHITNLLTGGSSCPQNFKHLPLQDGMTICVTQDFDAGFPFGGFFTCRTGNPLATTMHSDQSQWPKSCPKGFSSHLALVSNECEIEYCAQTKIVSDKGLPSVRKPPFMAYPNYRNVEKTEVFIDTHSNTWTKLPSDMLNTQEANLDLEKAKLVFRNNPQFEEQMQLIDIPTPQLTYGNTSTHTVYSNISTSSPKVNIKDVETTLRGSVASHRLQTDSNVVSDQEMKHLSDPREHQPLPSGVVVALSVISTLLCVCVIILLMMYKHRGVYRSDETSTLLG
ncbi:macrophage-expressed gene 1 protein-like [Ylistrum balloti]|uniref:macrophage-expressed gene 1 protein-like n=1 Tax=Ylistrum balloti TaxID=509963 RepID=UPI002905AB43|nr:macrophage-expressed gene 1 protein-like [Ylistrum balloti]